MSKSSGFGYKMNGISASSSRSSPSVPTKGRHIKLIESVKYYKQTTKTEEYYENGNLEFSHPPEITEMETEPASQNVTVSECSDEAFMAGRLRASKSSRNSLKVDGNVEERKSSGTPRGLSESSSSAAGSDIGVRPKKRLISQVLLSEDEEDLIKTRSADDDFKPGMYVLAKYSDNMYYPAQILTAAQASQWSVRFLDLKEEEDVHESALLKPSEWLTEKRCIMSKVGSQGGEYEEVIITAVIKQEAKAPRYSVKVQNSSLVKTVVFSEVALADDEVLRSKFDKPLRSNDTNGAVEFSEDDVVFGPWTDTRFYPGKIGEQKGAKFTVNFLDGQIAELEAENLILAEDLVRPGQHVQVQLPNANFQPGIIRTITGSPADNMQAMVDFDDKEDMCHISQMCFASKDARKALSAKTAALKAKEKKETRASTRVKTEAKPETPKVKPVLQSQKSTAKKVKTEVVSRKSVSQEPETVDNDDDTPKALQAYRIGQTVYRDKEQIFGLWEDKRWYAA